MTIAAIAGGARAAAIDVWTLYAAAIVSGFGVAIMQPGMPTLVREWLPKRIALGTIAYSAGMLMGAMFPAVFTIAYVLPRLAALGGSMWWCGRCRRCSWRRCFFCLSPKAATMHGTAASNVGGWWPDWKNPRGLAARPHLRQQ